MSVPSFRRWLRQFRGEESPIGDLARDIHADPGWPRGPGTLARYQEHLQEAGAAPDALAALHSAWRRYQQESAPVADAAGLPRITLGGPSS